MSVETVESTTKALSKMHLHKDAKKLSEATTQTKNVSSDDDEQSDTTAGTSEGREADVDAIKLFVGQIPRTMNKDELLPMFKEFGDVYSLSIIKHRITNEHAGCAFLTFYTRAAADKTIAALHDRRVLPGMKNAMQVKPAHGEFQCKLFVGMIPHECTASEIESIFLPFGEIVELNLLKRRSKLLNKGCAFIQFKYKHQAIKAIEELHGKHIIEGSNTPLVVKFADNRKAKKNARAAMGRGRWRGGQYMHHPYAYMRGGGFQSMHHGGGSVRPYPSHYYPSPVPTYQSHPRGGAGGGSGWHGGGYRHGWTPVYFDAPSYYAGHAGPNPSEMFYNQMHYPSMPYYGGAASSHHAPESPKSAASPVSPVSPSSSPIAKTTATDTAHSS